MHDYRELSRLTERTIHKYVQLEKQSHNYGGFNMTQTEIHTITVVGDYPNINVTRLAAVRGITKGAASQMIYKLVDKGFIKKAVSPNSDTEVCLNLTESGQKAYEAHRKYHDESGSAFFKSIAAMPEDVQEYLIQMLKQFDKALDERFQ